MVASRGLRQSNLHYLFLILLGMLCPFAALVSVCLNGFAFADKWPCGAFSVGSNSMFSPQVLWFRASLTLFSVASSSGMETQAQTFFLSVFANDFSLYVLFTIFELPGTFRKY